MRRLALASVVAVAALIAPGCGGEDGGDGGEADLDPQQVKDAILGNACVEGGGTSIPIWRLPPAQPDVPGEAPRAFAGSSPCSDVELEGRLASNEPEEPDETDPTVFSYDWFFVRSRKPQVEGWVNASSEVLQCPDEGILPTSIAAAQKFARRDPCTYDAGAVGEVLPAVTPKQLSPGALPDLAITDATLKGDVGDICSQPGATASFSVQLRNLGKGTSPSPATIEISDSQEPVTETIYLARGIEPNESIRNVGGFAGKSRLVVDPENLIKESNERNQGFTVPPSDLVCG